MMVLVSTTDIADPSVRGAPFEHGLVTINSECVGFRAVTLDSSLFTRAANRVPILPGSSWKSTRAGCGGGFSFPTRGFSCGSTQTL